MLTLKPLFSKPLLESSLDDLQGTPVLTAREVEEQTSIIWDLAGRRDSSIDITAMMAEDIVTGEIYEDVRSTVSGALTKGGVRYLILSSGILLDFDALITVMVETMEAYSALLAKQ